MFNTRILPRYAKIKKNLSGDRFREARVRLRLTRAEGVFLGRDSVGRIEIGSRLILDYELPVFAKAPRVSVDWLLEGEEWS